MDLSPIVLRVIASSIKFKLIDSTFYELLVYLKAEFEIDKIGKELKFYR